MLASTEKIVKEIPNIPVDDRLVLIDNLLKSVNLPAQEDVDSAWSEEVERRDRALDDGTAILIPGEEVLARVRERFSK
uniref:Putative addiction module component, TIGR02574 family n=2 Tax=unclassified Candidatus Kentrum TaxID=2643149 RepID=A0A451A1J4_9GAMM|nr:MAG: putative addiction module component, TIGR02574 family [Candidatus Kentron sp. LPFa]VFK59901.1 MAG: putative addiction module component, TIGR02574 family [Candidatus Kentron sp. UNK]VFK70162.1 MAG: putative addiction module component, TIGR02574 family [Candidatus Kentron sp. UNK]